MTDTGGTMVIALLMKPLIEVDRAIEGFIFLPKIRKEVLLCVIFKENQ